MRTEQLTEHRDRLRHVWTKLSTARVGALNPARALIELRTAMDNADSWFRDALRAARDGGQSSQVRTGLLFGFHLEQAHAGVQWLESALGLTRVPGLLINGQQADSNDLNDLRDLALQYAAEAVLSATKLIPSLRESLSDSQWLQFYLHILAVQALTVRALDDRIPSYGSLEGRLDEALSVEIEKVILHVWALSETDDSDDRRPWCLGAISRLLYLLGDPRASDLRFSGEQVSSRDGANEIQLVQLALAAIATNTDLEDSLARMSAAMSRVGKPFSLGRLGLLSKVTGNARHAVVELLKQERFSDSLTMLRALESWSYPRSHRQDVSVLHLIEGDTIVFGLLEKNGALVKVLDVEISRPLWSRLWHLAQDGSEYGVELLVENLSTEFSRFLRDESLSALQEISLDLHGLVSWIPWGALTSGGRRWGSQSLIARGEVPSSSARSASPDLLVIDTSFRNSQSVVKAFREYGSPPRTVVEFDSSCTRDEGLKRTILEAISNSESAIFYTHGVSDVLNSSHSGVPLDENAAVTKDGTATLTTSDIAGLEQVPGSCLLVGCQTGRVNPFIQGTSMADAFVAAGSEQVVSTLWPILADTGAKFAIDYLSSSGFGYQLASELTRLQRQSPGKFDGFQLFG